MPECYIRGSTIKYLRIPDEVIDMVKEEVIQKSKGRGDMRGRGGRGGRGGPGRGKFTFNLMNLYSSLRGIKGRCQEMSVLSQSMTNLQPKNVWIVF